MGPKDVPVVSSDGELGPRCHHQPVFLLVPCPLLPGDAPAGRCCLPLSSPSRPAWLPLLPLQVNVEKRLLLWGGRGQAAPQHLQLADQMLETGTTLRNWTPAAVHDVITHQRRRRDTLSRDAEQMMKWWSDDVTLTCRSYSLEVSSVVRLWSETRRSQSSPPRGKASDHESWSPTASRRTPTETHTRCVTLINYITAVSSNRGYTHNYFIKMCVCVHTTSLCVVYRLSARLSRAIHFTGSLETEPCL